MPLNVAATLKKALAELEAERAQIDRQLVALRQALGIDRGAVTRPRRRSRMSAAARRAVSQRMKAFWAKRRAAANAKKSQAADQVSKPRVKAKAHTR